jgi:hypothetical protein
MSKHKGMPSGLNKSENGTGIPSKISDDNAKLDNKITKKYTKDDKSIAEQVPLRHRNRNVNKSNATNIHGYRG